ncbi:hypothetical protein [Mycobacterium sp. IS-3022]|uniref:hypothetical protein n=1 Tax=Mycobacterium sp. IS-3022 TaxID=1772277 RepID=UPI000AEDD942|nr:hypothetical protein [Mycobacterium sp. IS-3022]
MFDDRDYVALDECARRMNLTKAQVMHLVRIRALRAFNAGFGMWFVEPAIVTGAVTTP